MMDFGLMSAIVTPMLDDCVTVNEKELARIVEDQLKNGMNSLLVLGGTGENTALTQEMRKTCLDVVVSTVQHRVPVVAGVTELGYHDNLIAAEMAKNAGADAILVSTPLGATTVTKGCVEFFKVVDAAVDMPMLVYNFPGRTGYNAAPDVLEALLDAIPNIVGIKDCALKFEQSAENIDRFGKRVAVLSGNERLCPYEILIGANGGAMASSNVIPAKWAEIYAAAKSGNIAGVNQLSAEIRELQKVLFAEPNPAPIKYAMSLQGFRVGKPITPLCEISDGLKVKIRTEMEKLNLI